MLTLLDLEFICESAGTIDAFLSSRDHLEHYFLTAADYYKSDRFTREIFDDVVSQVKTAVAADARFADRLWKKQETHAWNFSIACGRAEDRGIYPAAWAEYLSGWIARLESHIQAPYKTLPVLEFISRAESDLRLIKAECAAFETDLSLQGLNKKNAGLRRGDFYRSLSRRADVISIAARNILEKFKQPYIRTRLECEDANIILDLIRLWLNDPMALVIMTLKPNAEPILSVIRDSIPSMKELSALTEIFPPRSYETKNRNLVESNAIKEGTYVFEAVPRYFHAIFRGPAGHDCLAWGGRTGHGGPSRWLLGCTERSQTLHIRSRDRFYGAVFLNEAVLRETQVGLLEFWSPLMGARALLKQGERSQLFAQCALREIQKRKPAHWQQLCFTDDLYFDNWGVVRIIMQSEFAHFLTRVGTSVDLKVQDDLCERLCQSLASVYPSDYKATSLVYAGTTSPDKNVFVPDFEFQIG